MLVEIGSKSLGKTYLFFKIEPFRNLRTDPWIHHMGSSASSFGLLSKRKRSLKKLWIQGNCTAMIKCGWNCIWPLKEELEASKIPSEVDGSNKVVFHTVPFCHTHIFSPSDWMGMGMEMELNKPWQFYNHTNKLPFSSFSSEPLARCLTKCLNGGKLKKFPLMGPLYNLVINCELILRRKVVWFFWIKTTAIVVVNESHQSNSL